MLEQIVSIISISLAVLIATIAGNIVYGILFRAHIDRRVGKALANALRHAKSYKRSTELAVTKAVSNFESQGRFIDQQTQATATLCVEKLEEIRTDIVRQLSAKPADGEYKGRDHRNTLPFSIQAVRDRAEKRTAEQIEQDRLNKPIGSKAK